MGKVFLDSCMIIFFKITSTSGKKWGENPTIFPICSSEFLCVLSSGLLLKLPDVKIFIRGIFIRDIYISGSSGKQRRSGPREDNKA